MVLRGLGIEKLGLHTEENFFLVSSRYSLALGFINFIHENIPGLA